MVQLPYLQPFEDVNKRVSRLAANIPLVRRNLSPLSFVDVPQRPYIDGLLGVYELNRVELPWRVQAQPAGVVIEDLRLRSELGQIAARGTLDSAAIARAGLLSGGILEPSARHDVEVRSSIDLARLAAMLPQALHLRRVQRAGIEHARLDALEVRVEEGGGILPPISVRNRIVAEGPVLALAARALRVLVGPLARDERLASISWTFGAGLGFDFGVDRHPSCRRM